MDRGNDGLRRPILRAVGAFHALALAALDDETDHGLVGQDHAVIVFYGASECRREHARAAFRNAPPVEHLIDERQRLHARAGIAAGWADEAAAAETGGA